MMIRELYYSQQIPFSIEEVERRATENPSPFRRTWKKAESNCKGDSNARRRVLWIACHLFDLAPHCYYCGQEGSADSLTLDHFNPRSKPGTSIAIGSAGIEYRKHEANHPWNVVWACGHCNKLKDNLCSKDFQRILDDPLGFFRESRYSANKRKRLRAFAEIYYLFIAGRQGYAERHHLNFADVLAHWEARRKSYRERWH